MEGRDIGKIKKEGYFRGSQANRIRFVVVGSGLAIGLLFGVLLIYRGHRFNKMFMVQVEDWERQYKDQRERATEIHARRIRDVRKKADDDEL